MDPAAPPHRRVVIAPDSFKGSLSAAEAADALARGWLRGSPGDRVLGLPMADGGEGTLDAVLRAVPGSRSVPVRVDGPSGSRVDAHWVRLPNGDAAVELAAASGILLLRRDASGRPELRPLDAHTRGTGQAIRAAIESGARRVFVGLGGSASTDGGSGILQALGVRLLDRDGTEIPPGNRHLTEAARVDFSGRVTLPPDGLVVWSDVTAPLLGELGAARVFGPQKGMDEAMIADAERGLQRLSDVLGGDPRAAGAGAAGGAGYALGLLGGVLTSGAEAVARMIGLEERIAEADLVITGEGRFDLQSERGKTVSRVRASAAAHRRPVALIAGRIEAPVDGFAWSASLTMLARPGESPMRDAARILERAGEQLASRCS
ncbi:glycerate kinase [Leucobacter weissii]|uniref:Glycerate kinase n=1 Tax=Leucobacter weissii TaxID=1983706 RepID=A0A939MHR6_9MICO|nr:glycerate kinase [Leucobacter weissii]MBO1900968.1 glycerate kinase [Leucobacter weissii]